MKSPPTTPAGSGEKRVVLLLSLIGGLAMLVLSLVLLSPLAPTAADPKTVILGLRVGQQDLKPEPLERFLYISGVLLAPFCLGGSYLGIRRLQRGPKGRRIIERLASPVAWLMAPLMCILLFFAGFVEDKVIVGSFMPSGKISLAAAIVLALGATAAFASRSGGRMSRILRVLLPGLAGLLFLGILSFNILGAEHISNIPIFMASFNAVFYSVVQVFFGKELLVDFVNQYGLYPHFLAPVFHAVGLSVYTFTMVMGLLNCLAFGCMYRFLAKETADELLAFLGLATILFFGFFAGRMARHDLYFQYQPLRILFPALSLLLVHTFARGPTPIRGALHFALGGAAFLWNPDTGIIVLAAGFLLLIYDAVLRRRSREIPVRLLSGVAAATIVFAVFTCLLRLRYGAFPDYARLFDHLDAFYVRGANMLPMPRFGLWVPVLLVYATGLLLSLADLVEGEDTPRARLLFYLSVLGLGIFTYYQGRSTLGGLMLAAYPAVILIVLFLDDYRLSMQRHGRLSDQVVSVTLLALLFYSVPALATIAPGWGQAIAGKIRVTTSGKEGEVVRDANFIRRYVRTGEEVVIVSFNSGVHHLMTQTTNPLDIPSDSEIVFLRDTEKQDDYINSRRGAFVIDKNTFDPTLIGVLRRMYPDFHENPEGALIVFPLRDVSSRPRGRQ